MAGGEPEPGRVLVATHRTMMSFRQKLVVSARNLSSTSSNMAATAPATVTLDNMNPCIKKMEYAVRGPLVIRATAIEKVGVCAWNTNFGLNIFILLIQGVP